MVNTIIDEFPDITQEEIQDLAVKTFKAIGCNGVIRIDFIIDQDTNKIYVNGTLFFTIEPNGNLNCKGDIYERIR